MILANLRAQAWKWGCIAFAVLAVVAVAGCLFFQVAADRDRSRADAASERAEQSAAQLRDAKAVIATERAKAQVMATIANQHEQDKADDQAAYRRDLAGLRAGNLKLRSHWQGCQATAAVSGTAASAALADAAEQLRAADTAALIAIGRAADTKDRAQRAVIEADRK